MKFFTSMLLTFCILISCGVVDKKDPPHETDIEDVKLHLAALKTIALNDADENGWIATDCDGMLWNGKYAAATSLGDITSSEFDASGRFGRTPAKRCFEEGKDNGSKSTWSRDMAIGFIYWAFRTDDLDVLQRHSNYGTSNQWKMGEPLSDGRVLYNPGLIGLLYNAIYSLGGSKNTNRLWPSIWPSGLTDFEAHLQVLKIALVGEIAESLNEADAIPQRPLIGGDHLGLLSISTTMYKRLEEHAQREPNDVFFQVVYAKYSGDYSHAINLCSGQITGIHAGYVRCDDNISCKLANEIFACDFLVRQFNG